MVLSLPCSLLLAPEHRDLVRLAGPPRNVGPASYVIRSGTSMERTYNDGGLVVLRESQNYNGGDVVAYRTEDYYQSGRAVIYHIVDEGEAGYVTRGDNLRAIDDWRPAAEQIMGKACFTIPAVGTYLGRLTPYRGRRD